MKYYLIRLLPWIERADAPRDTDAGFAAVVAIRLIGAAAVLASAAIWLLTALMSYWTHLSPGFLSHLTLS